MSTVKEIAIIGAGPFGLAAAAHLRASGMETVVVGSAMAFWKGNMPRGMLLRSPWRGSHIADPDRKLTLDHFFCNEAQSPVERIPIATFIRYGEWFQSHVIPDLDTRKVVRVEHCTSGFRLLAEDGEPILARRVVVATGLIGHSYKPPQYAGLPNALVSHSSEHFDLAQFQGRRVAVIGAGQSALESAAILLDHGAEVDLIVRGRAVNWIGGNPVSSGGAFESGMRRIAERLAPPSPVGPFPMNWMFEVPALMRYLPPRMRGLMATRGLRAGASSWLMPRIERLRIQAGRVVLSARRVGERVTLQLDNDAGLLVDHVVLATGYHIRINQYSFLSPDLVSGIASAQGSPVLSGGLESSVPGLHFIGAPAVASFGPLMRFVWGAGFASRRLASHLRHRRETRPARALNLPSTETMIETATSKSVS